MPHPMTGIVLDVRPSKMQPAQLRSRPQFARQCTTIFCMKYDLLSGDPPGGIVACIWVCLHPQALLNDVQCLLPVLLRALSLMSIPAAVCAWTGQHRHGSLVGRVARAAAIARRRSSRRQPAPLTTCIVPSRANAYRHVVLASSP